VVDHPSEWTTDRILWTITPIQLPGWSIIFQSTHTRKLTLRHLVLKFLLQRINKNESIVLTNLVIGLPEDEYEILILILSNQDKTQKHLKEILEQIVEHNFLGITDPYRDFKAFVPELHIFKIWTQRAMIAPKRYIGVGYNDHGTLSTAPSWKDQLTDHEDETPRLSVMHFSLKVIFGLDLYRNSPFKGSFRLTSSNKSETG